MGHLTSLPKDFKPPHQILSELGIQSPSQISVEAIAEHCGATVLYEKLEGSEARLVGVRSRAIITVNKDSLASRQRFSAAHELGHWMWDRGKISYQCQDRDFDGERETDASERRANRYAVDLLLPESMFIPLSEAEHLSFHSIRRWSQFFRTSLIATALRAVELWKTPALLIGVKKGKRAWYAKSPATSEEIKLKKELESPLDSWVRTWPKGFAYLPSEILTENLDVDSDLSLVLITW